jgi:SAM-dependent methyltransferase
MSLVPEQMQSVVRANTGPWLADVIGWDIVNWSRAFDFWSGCERVQRPGADCLELGCGKLSSLGLWLAMRGHRVVCSDLGGVSEGIKEMHRRHGVAQRIEYTDVDACATGYREAFDIIVFKSMLGGIAANAADAQRVVSGVYDALKPGGVLLMAENMRATPLHSLGRARFGAGKLGWRYFSAEEIGDIVGCFGSFEMTSFGFLGCFGRSESQRALLGRVDRSFDRLLPRRWHYVGAVIARK